jgi:hypothetical protein
MWDQNIYSLQHWYQVKIRRGAEGGGILSVTSCSGFVERWISKFQLLSYIIYLSHFIILHPAKERFPNKSGLFFVDLFTFIIDKIVLFEPQHSLEIPPDYIRFHFPEFRNNIFFLFTELGRQPCV